MIDTALFFEEELVNIESKINTFNKSAPQIKIFSLLIEQKNAVEKQIEQVLRQLEAQAIEIKNNPEIRDKSKEGVKIRRTRETIEKQYRELRQTFRTERKRIYQSLKKTTSS